MWTCEVDPIPIIPHTPYNLKCATLHDRYTNRLLTYFYPYYARTAYMFATIYGMSSLVIDNHNNRRA